MQAITETRTGENLAVNFAPNSSRVPEILGWYGSDNTGDEAVLGAIVDALRRRGVTDIHALSINPSKTASRLAISSSPRSLASLDTLKASNTPHPEGQRS